MKYYNIKNTKVILGFAVGVSVGAIAAILFSPGKGKDTRKKIADKTSDWGIALKDSFTDFLKFKKSSTKNDRENQESAKMKLNTMG